jgi:hypothetical protein
MTHFKAIDQLDLSLVTGGAGIDDPTAPTLSDLRSSNTGFEIGPPSSHIAPAPVINPIAPPFTIK